MRRPAPWKLAVGVMVGLAACDSGPSGPGVLTGTVTAPQQLGAVVLEVTGTGIEGFEPQGGDEAYGAQVSAQNGRYRVVVVGTGVLHFGLKVDDVKAPHPDVQVVLAVDDQNAPLAGADVKVALSR
jgi:hypothetical protein